MQRCIGRDGAGAGLDMSEGGSVAVSLCLFCMLGFICETLWILNLILSVKSKYLVVFILF